MTCEYKTNILTIGGIRNKYSYDLWNIKQIFSRYVEYKTNILMACGI